MLRRVLLAGNAGLAIAAGAAAGDLVSRGLRTHGADWLLLGIAAVVLLGNLYYLGICRSESAAEPGRRSLFQRLGIDRLMDDRYMFAACFLLIGAFGGGPLTAFLALIVALLLETSGMIRRLNGFHLPTAAEVVWSVTLWSTCSYLVGRISAALAAMV